jgi:hypothetical protein
VTGRRPLANPNWKTGPPGFQPCPPVGRQQAEYHQFWRWTELAQPITLGLILFPQRMPAIYEGVSTLVEDYSEMSFPQEELIK